MCSSSATRCVTTQESWASVLVSICLQEDALLGVLGGGGERGVVENMKRKIEKTGGEEVSGV